MSSIRTFNANAWASKVDSGSVFMPGGPVVPEPPVPITWAFIWKGSSGGGRADVWLYPTEGEALEVAAKGALEAGCDLHPACVKAFRQGRFRRVVDHYSSLAQDSHLLCVVPAYFHRDGEDQQTWEIPDSIPEGRLDGGGEWH